MVVLKGDLVSETYSGKRIEGNAVRCSGEINPTLQHAALLVVTLRVYVQQGYAFGRVGLCIYIYVWTKNRPV